MSFGHIYLMICHADSDKKYVGYSRNWQRRITEHFQEARNDRSGRLNEAIRKFPDRSLWEFKILENCENFEACQNSEKKWIIHHGTRDEKIGYNITPGGNGWGWFDPEKSGKKLSQALKGKKFTPEHKERIRQARLGTKRSQATLDKMSKGRMGFKHTPEARAKISEAGRKRKMSEYTKEKLRLANIGRKFSPETRLKMRLSHLKVKNEKR